MKGAKLLSEMSGWDLEVLGIMFDETLSAIVFRDAEGLDEGGMDTLEEPFPLGDRPPPHDLDLH
jgi:hypothetical protein